MRVFRLLSSYASGVDADDALAFEKVATQITTVKAMSAAAQGSGQVLKLPQMQLFLL